MKTDNYNKKVQFYHTSDRLLKFYVDKHKKIGQNGKSEYEEIKGLVDRLKECEKYEAEYEKIKRENYLLREEIRNLKCYNQENVRLIDNFKILLNQKQHNFVARVDSNRESEELSNKLKLKSIEIAHLKKFNFFLSEWNSWASKQLNDYRNETQSAKLDLAKAYEKIQKQLDESKRKTQFENISLRSEVVKLRSALKQKQQKCIYNEKKYLECQAEMKNQYKQFHEQIQGLKQNLENVMQKYCKEEQQNLEEFRYIKQVELEKLSQCDYRFDVIKRLTVQEEVKSYEAHLLIEKFIDYENQIKNMEQQNKFLQQKNKELEQTLSKTENLRSEMIEWSRKNEMEFYHLHSLIDKKRNQFKNILATNEQRQSCLKCADLETLFLESITVLKEQSYRIEKNISELLTRLLTTNL